MTLHRILLLAWMMLTMSHCMDSAGKTIAQTVLDYHTQLMALHDTTMRQFDISGNLAEQLKKLGGMAGDTVNTNSIDSIRTELNASNEYMMDWMNAYKEPETKDSAALKYINIQIDLLHQLAIHQHKTIQQANLILHSTK